MNQLGIEIRCMRCGEVMDLRDPQPGMPWSPDQFWVCPRCGRHFWTTYPPPKPAATAAPAAAAPAAPAASAAKPTESTS